MDGWMDGRIDRCGYFVELCDHGGSLFACKVFFFE